MSLEIAISPGGRLFVERAAEIVAMVNEKWASRLQAAFDASAAEGLLLLATDALTLSVPPSPTYWRDFARGYLQRLCHTGGVDGGPVPPLPSERDELSLVGLAISFALPTFAQQTNTPDPRQREWLVALDKKHAEPWNKNDAAAVAALFTEDAVYVTDRGPVNGRQAIEKYFADMHFSNHLITVDQFSPHFIGTAGDEMWATGEWSLTIQGQNFGPVEAKGYWGAIKVREGDDNWKIRMLTFNTTPPPTATGTATPSPTTTPSNQ